MPLKDILVHLDASPRCATRLQLAVALARQHDAHLIGLHVIDPWCRRWCWRMAAAAACCSATYRPAAGAGHRRGRPD